MRSNLEAICSKETLKITGSVFYMNELFSAGVLVHGAWGSHNEVERLYFDGWSAYCLNSDGCIA